MSKETIYGAGRYEVRMHNTPNGTVYTIKDKGAPLWGMVTHIDTETGHSLVHGLRSLAKHLQSTNSHRYIRMAEKAVSGVLRRSTPPSSKPH